MLKRIGIAVSMFVLLLWMLLMIMSAPVEADDQPPIISVVLEGVTDLTGISSAPEIVMMTTDEIKFDACLRPPECPNYVSVHPPMSNKILVNSDIDITRDLSAQKQLAHVMTMFALEKAGRYSPDMPCKQAAAQELYANQIATAYVMAVEHEYVSAGHKSPMVGNPQVMSFCTPDEPRQQMETF